MSSRRGTIDQLTLWTYLLYLPESLCIWKSLAGFKPRFQIRWREKEKKNDLRVQGSEGVRDAASSAGNPPPPTPHRAEAIKLLFLLYLPAGRLSRSRNTGSVKFPRSHIKAPAPFIMTSEPSEVNEHEGRPERRMGSQPWRGDPSLLRAVEGGGGSLTERARGVEKDYIYHHAYVLPSKKAPAFYFLRPASHPDCWDGRDSHKGFGGIINTAWCWVSNA